jgi:Tol biopolymer transport system component
MGHKKERSKTLASLTLCLGALSLLVVAGAGAALLPQLERASLTAAGQQSNGSSLSFANPPADPPLDSRRILSGDGRYVVFDSFATNLVPNDLNGNADVFVRDRLAEVTERVSVNSAGNEALGNSYSAEISADGRWIVFVSAAANLVPMDLNGASDVFLHDRQSGTTERLSVGTDGGDADGASLQPAISADGGTVAFVSHATNLVTGDGNGLADVFVLDLASSVTERVSIADGGGDSDAASRSPVLSGDGARVAFVSLATNLVPGPQTPFVQNIFLRDRGTDTTTKISTRHDGSQAVAGSRDPTLSADGRWLAFASSDWLLVDEPDVDDIIEDVFLFDLETGERTLVTASDDTRATARTNNPSLSDDGRFLAFASRSRTLLAGKTYNGTDVYVYDRTSGEITRASRGLENDRGGTDGDFCSELPTLSGDGHLVGFKSTSTNLVGGDTNGFADVFVGVAGFLCQASDECATDDSCLSSPGVCNLGDQSCVFQSRPDGTACEDGSPCTAEAACAAGTCVRLSEITCEPAGPCFVAGTCNPMSGLCSTPLAPNGTPCSLSGGEVECSTGGSCFFGDCRGGLGTEDPDGDRVCSLDDNCPTTVNPTQSDADLDLEGDSCDPRDGEIRIARARLRWNRTASSESGTATVWGELRNPVGAGAFPSDQPLAIHIRDGLDLDFSFIFPASDCRRSRGGTILCRSDSLRGVILTLRPGETSGGVESFRVKLKAAGLDLPGPFQPPVALSIVRQPPVRVLGIDCFGDILSCRSTPRGMRCAAP